MNIQKCHYSGKPRDQRFVFDLQCSYIEIDLLLPTDFNLTTAEGSEVDP